MNFIKQASIKQKLILMIMLTTIVTLMIVGTALVVIDQKTARSTMIERLDTLSRVIADRSTAAIRFDDPEAAKQMLSALKQDASVLVACTYTLSQELFAIYNRPDGLDCPSKLQQDSIFFKEQYFHLYHSISLKGKKIGTLYILATLREIKERLLWFVVTVIVIIFLASVAAFYLANKLQSYITNPLIKLRDVTEYISSHADYSHQLPRGSEDEIGVLYHSFSKMIEQIQIRNTQRKRVEEELKVSLAEKEVLLKEVHHRVKNNMAMINAFIQLQIQQTKNPSELSALAECENRIHAMAMVHKKLYQSKDLSSIDMLSLFKELSDALYASIANGNVSINIQADDIHLDMDIAIPCAMIVNELLSNSLKYAFVNGKPGKIDIEMNTLGLDEYHIVFSDDGCGLPDDIDIDQAKTLGLQLVYIFIHQLKGTLTIDKQSGTTFNMRFPNKIVKDR